jgi:simple sugar transport system permease protein
MIGQIPGMDVHWGLVVGAIACVAAFVLMRFTVFGFAARIVGGNVRAARISGLPVARLTVITCFIAGAAAGLAGMIEVAAVQGRVSSSLVVGYGYTGILVAFVARQNPLAVIPMAILLGGINASSGLVQRSHNVPDATVLVMQGIIFLMILVSEPLYGRFRLFQPRVPAHG